MIGMEASRAAGLRQFQLGAYVLLPPGGNARTRSPRVARRFPSTRITFSEWPLLVGGRCDQVTKARRDGALTRGRPLVPSRDESEAATELEWPTR